MSPGGTFWPHPGVSTFFASFFFFARAGSHTELCSGNYGPPSGCASILVAKRGAEGGGSIVLVVFQSE